MNVLITGGGGFIGSHLVDSQLQVGNLVRTIDLHTERLDHLNESRNLEIVHADLTNLEILDALVKDIDVIYHLASAHLDVSLSDDSYALVNIEATTNLLHAAWSAGVKRFVHVSSVGVIGDVAQPPADEESVCKPTNIYEQTKLAGETAVLDFHRQTGFQVVVVRPAWVYGPRCPRTQKLLRTIAKGRFFFFGSGKNLRHPLYYRDCIAGLEQAAAVEGVAGQVFILAGEKPVTTRDLVETAAEYLEVSIPGITIPVGFGEMAGRIFQGAFRLINRQPPFSTRTLDFFTKNNAYNIAKAQQVLGFCPETDLQTGFAETIQWMTAQKLLPDR